MMNTLQNRVRGLVEELGRQKPEGQAVTAYEVLRALQSRFSNEYGRSRQNVLLKVIRNTMAAPRASASPGGSHRQSNGAGPRKKRKRSRGDSSDSSGSSSDEGSSSEGEGEGETAGVSEGGGGARGGEQRPVDDDVVMVEVPSGGTGNAINSSLQQLYRDQGAAAAAAAAASSSSSSSFSSSVAVPPVGGGDGSKTGGGEGGTADGPIQIPDESGPGEGGSDAKSKGKGAPEEGQKKKRPGEGGTQQGQGGRRLRGKERNKLHKAVRQEISGRADASGADGGASRSFEPEETPDITLSDVGGLGKLEDDIKEIILMPLQHPEVFQHLGVKPPTGILLHGPPGSGKTHLAMAIAGTAKVPFFKVAAPEMVSGMSGESEALLRSLFAAARACAPALIFIDEIDAICPKRENAGREMERRIVAQMLTCMDELQGAFVLVLGATNRVEAMDGALRRAGRFDRELAMGIPDEDARERILSVMSQGIRLSGETNMSQIAKMTPGFVGADLSAVVKEAALLAVSRVRRQFPDLEGPFPPDILETLAVQKEDFEKAVSRVQPSARREGFATIPDVSFKDVGAVAELRRELELSICEPIREQKLFHELGIVVPAGVLLYGPPGCGKTLLAKAVASESGANFISVKGPELLNKYVGESERAVRLVFERARVSAPCVIFFDELDALCPARGSEGSSSTERVVNQLLTEMDGVADRRSVFVLAATNRPDIVDPAMLRPGRLDKLLYVPLPSRDGRLEILQKVSRKSPLAIDVDVPALADRTEGFSGADLAAVVREAAVCAIDAVWMQRQAMREKEDRGEMVYEIQTAESGPAGGGGRVEVTMEHFEAALKKVSPSVSGQSAEKYARMKEKLRGTASS
uniref:AAA+ ATPase domain-containing protein n=1 Tax=Chromera velia CCMP2878 TaxID=1169474 RepID=A0A0G4I8T5_9ALVE|eukprot:Cvel_11961.t1-p1 / transcript=Cvel_11961.t1 / gene=Cvel_11961 / organism=Chromera_velia_CCMP2878 / gene_product=Uncharacterized AAA domain-containing protein, putative / transcript_product=Uncharacterized AAA domain-containing protein, putative / location=Cvel_scaffold766:45770-51966(+) / protein_length=864 / sequence_SO=supercontig / SO=protein_coding / is_pseudo=false